MLCFQGESDSVITSGSISYTAKFDSSKNGALLQPQPEVHVVDRYGNIGAVSKEQESVIAMPCEYGVKFGKLLCVCSNLTCLRPVQISNAIQYAILAMDGQVIIPIADSKAVFTNLRLFYASPKLRISFWLLSSSLTVLLQSPAMTSTFSVSPGSVDHMLLLDQPAASSGCARCPTGVYIARSLLPVSLQFFDYFQNPIAFCDGPDLGCAGIPTSNVAVRICQGMKTVVADIGGQTTAQAQSGLVNFTDLYIIESGENYDLLFHYFNRSLAHDFYCNMTQNNSAFVRSLPFSITNSAPAKLIVLNNSAMVSVDFEPFPTDVVVQVTDEFNNTILSNCYSAPEEHPTKCCISFQSAKNNCNFNLSVNVTSKSQAVGLAGKTVVAVEHGFAFFTDLALKTNFIPDCDKPSTYFLRFDAFLAHPTYLPILLENPVHYIFLDVQPTEVSARESFYPSPRVSARDCANKSVKSRNFIGVEIAFNGGFGTLEGRTLVQMEGGVAVFTDLSIDLTGNRYSLRFSYIGIYGDNFNVSSIVSNDFDVFLPAPYLEFVSGTDPNGSFTKAGAPFTVQPQIKSFIREGQLDLNSISIVTASIGSNPGNEQAQDPGNSHLLGTVQVKVVNGLAIFTDLGLNKASIHQNLNQTKGYSLIFSTSTAHVQSGFFQILPQNLSGLWLPRDYQPARLTSEAGNPFLIQPAIFFVDQFNNLVDDSLIPTNSEVTVSILQEQNYSATVYLLQETVINKCSDCCTGMRPTVCRPPSKLPITSTKSADGIVYFTDLRIDIASESYRLVFYMSNQYRVRNVTSDPFVITNTIPSYPEVIKTLSSINIADQPLIQQPIVTVVDRFGNAITYDDISNRTVKVTLHPPEGYFAELAAGTATESVCEFLPEKEVLVGTLEVPVDPKRGWGVFTDLMVRQALTGFTLEFAMKTSVGVVFVNTSQFSVKSGVSAGICSIGAPALCSAGGSCSSYVDVVCVDSFGNINKSCLTRLGSQYGVPLCGGMENFSCVAVSLRFSSSPRLDCTRCPGEVGQRCLCSKSLNPFLPCTNKPGGISQWISYSCKTGIPNGISKFTDLVFYKAGRNYSLVFTTFVQDDWLMQDIMWSTQSDIFQVTPTPPSILSAVFSESLNELYVLFDRATSMPTVSAGNLCNFLLGHAFYISLGQNPKCLWTQPDQLQITLGRNAYVNGSTQVILNVDSKIVAEEIVDGIPMDSVPATTVEGVMINGEPVGRVYPQLPPVLSSPTPIILAPSELTACDLVRADARLSYGNLGRPFEEVLWGLDYTKSKLDVGTFAAISEPTFIIREISFSSDLPGDNNIARITLRSNSAVLPGTNITISGLPSLAYCGSDIANESCADMIDPEYCCPLSFLSGSGIEAFSTWNGRPSIFWFNDTQWVLSVNSSKFISESDDITFSFVLRNPPIVQKQFLTIEAFCHECVCLDEKCASNRSFAIESLSMQMNCEGLCLFSDLAIYEVVDHLVSLAAGNITESCNVSGQLNFLTVTIKPTYDLPAGSVIVVGGLNGSISHSGNICIYGQDSDSFETGWCVEKGTVAPFAFWNATSTELLVTVRSGMKLKGNYFSKISFQLQNSVSSNRMNCMAKSYSMCKSWARPYVQFVYPTDLGQRGARYALFGDVLGSGEVVKFFGANVRQSNSIAGAENLLTFSFSSNFPIPPGAVILITGLAELDWFKKFSPSNIPVQNGPGQTSNCFSNAVVFGSDLSLTAIASCYYGLPSSSFGQIIFAIKVINAKQQQPAVQLFISAHYTARQGSFSISQQVMNGPVLESSVYPRFYEFAMSDSNNVVGQLNVLTIQFKSSITLMPGTSITVSGLFGIVRDDNSEKMAKISTQMFEVLENQTLFRADIGTFEMNTTFLLEKDVLCEVQFMARNGFISMVGKQMTFTINAFAIIEDDNTVETFSTVLNNSNALLINGMATAQGSISELSMVSYAYNMLTISVFANIDIHGPSSVTVHGLSNSKIPFADWNTSKMDGVVLDSSYSVFPNCSCSLYQVQPDLGCLDPCPGFVSTLPIQAQLSVVDSNGLSLLHEKNEGDVSGLARWEQETEISFCAIRNVASDCGQLVFQFAEGRFVRAGDIFFVRFLALNSEMAVPPSFPAISILPVQIQYNFSIIGPLLLSTPNDLGVLSSKEAPQFLSAFISFETSVPGFATKIEVSFQANCPLISPGSPAQIQLSGLRGFSSPDGLIRLYGESSFLISKSAVADWNLESGSVTMMGGTVLNDRNCSFYFFLVRSPNIPNTSSSLTIIGQSNGVTLGPQLLSYKRNTPADDLASNPARSNLYGEISILNVTETTNLQGVINNLTIGFSSNIRLFPRTSITFSGFVGSSSVFGSIPLFGEDSNLFGVAFWNPGPGEIRLSVLDDFQIEPNKLYSFSFDILNPTIPWPDPTRMLQATGSVLYDGQWTPIPPSIFSTHSFCAKKMPEFTTATIHESNTVDSAMNTLTITLIANVNLLIGSSITLQNAEYSEGLDFGVDSNIPVSGTTAQKKINFTAHVKPKGVLILSIFDAIAIGKTSIFNVIIRNRNCNFSCNGSDVLVSYSGGIAMPTVQIRQTRLSGRTQLWSIQNGGTPWSWIDKFVLQSTVVKNAVNRLIFTLRPNAPLFPGSVLIIRGLRGSQTWNCESCSGRGDRVSGLGCSTHCSKCRNNCITVWQNDTQPHSIFLDSAADWTNSNGTLRLTLATAINEEFPTTFTIFLRNSNKTSKGTECTPNNTLGEISHGTCLTVLVENIVLTPPEFISASTLLRGNQRLVDGQGSAVDSYNIPLMDSCATCIRPADLVVFDKTMNLQDALILNQIPVFSTSLSGLPTRKPGVPASGTYALALRLTNWIGMSGQSSSVMYIASSIEIVKPLVVINTSSEIIIQHPQSFQLMAFGTSPECLGYTEHTLRYIWAIECLEGPCSLMPTLERISPSIFQNVLFVEGGMLPPGGTFQLKCTVSDSIESSSASVLVKVQVRPLEVQILGMSIGGIISADSLYYLKADVYDPEVQVTNISSSDFESRWYCNETNLLFGTISSCSDFFFSFNTSFAILNTFYFVPENSYLLTLVVSRDLSKLPPIFRKTASGEAYFAQSSIQKVIISSDCSNVDDIIECTQVVSSDSAVVYMKLCDIEDIGKEDFCSRGLDQTKLSANTNLVLFASAKSNEGASFSNFFWDIRNNTNDFVSLSGNSFMLMPESSPWLVLSVGALVSGSKSTGFRASIVGPSVAPGHATLTFSVSTIPFGGDFSVQPDTGQPLQTVFSFNAIGWSADAEDLPLQYNFFYVDNMTGFQIFVGAGYGLPSTFPGVATSLPLGNPQQNFALMAGAVITNAFGSSVQVSETIRVIEVAALDTFQVFLLEYTQNLSNVTSYQQLESTGKIMGTLNSINTLCDDFSDQTSNLLCSSVLDRIRIRSQLLNTIMNLLDQVESGEFLLSCIKVLASSSVTVSELELSDTIIMVEILRRAGFLSKQINVDSTEVARISSAVLENLFRWFAADLRSRSARRSMDSDVLVLMQSISNISSMSVRQALPGMQPSILVPSSLLEITTYRISSSEFNGISIGGKSSEATVVLDKDLLDPLNSVVEIEIMQAVMMGSLNPLPPSIGDIVIVEIRALGSDQVLSISKHLSSPATITVCVLWSICRAYSTVALCLWNIFFVQVPTNKITIGFPDKATGKRTVPFVLYFDINSWLWSTSGIHLLSYDNYSVTAQSYHLSYFSAQLVSAGCDGVPLSNLVLDSCRICGGNNSTCSGCDGIPNTGRNRNCSGNGVCGVNECICDPDWLGDACHIYCR